MRNLSEIVTRNLIDSNHKVLKLTTAFSLLIDHWSHEMTNVIVKYQYK